MTFIPDEIRRRRRRIRNAIGKRFGLAHCQPEVRISDF
jgi:hypothetical protein